VILDTLSPVILLRIAEKIIQLDESII